MLFGKPPKQPIRRNGANYMKIVQTYGDVIANILAGCLHPNQYLRFDIEQILMIVRLYERHYCYGIFNVIKMSHLKSLIIKRSRSFESFATQALVRPQSKDDLDDSLFMELMKGRNKIYNYKIR